MLRSLLLSLNAPRTQQARQTCWTDDAAAKIRNDEGPDEAQVSAGRLSPKRMWGPQVWSEHTGRKDLEKAARSERLDTEKLSF